VLWVDNNISKGHINSTPEQKLEVLRSSVEKLEVLRSSVDKHLPNYPRRDPEDDNMKFDSRENSRFYTYEILLHRWNFSLGLLGSGTSSPNY
jgi:hypothetical protein